MTPNWPRKIGSTALTMVCLATLIASTEETGGSTSGGGAQSESTNAAEPEKSEADDVVIASCGVDELGQLESTLTVTNNSSKASDYYIELVFESADGSMQLDSTFASVTNLAPGQQTKAEAISFTDAPAGQFKCRVVDVMRTASL